MPVDLDDEWTRLQREFQPDDFGMDQETRAHNFECGLASLERSRSRRARIAGALMIVAGAAVCMAIFSIWGVVGLLTYVLIVVCAGLIIARSKH